MTFEQSKPVRIMTSILRPLNFIGGIGAIAVAVLFLFTHIDPFYTILNLLFTGLLGMLLLAGEFNLSLINDNCKFLVTYLGRGHFNLFVGGWVFGLHPIFNAETSTVTDVGDIITLTVYITLWVLGIFFILMHFMGKSKFIYDIEK
mmetsp:Transcript_56239/g.64518  ORF Transcript_56239/g.64518 Transcript_56239/m.64518 type:complete len:146 (+) Transcript_56239:38-475(+)|eukprot:CAMPEP_0176436546 /NCGR_PEP_ID=MMETSP0127-20121128/18037_1 /TAXON_ID=938130 /ORGANISM="Platyophrya macrostoma, Strain WH" /LENGTH=145 /DNA_ID=CAMNT_0017819895 /DNA_START=32 /DNA_END=469 /DNA_ORIENTATION=-